MDGTAAINFNLEALKRILAGLVAMAGLANFFTSPLRGGRREASGGGCDAEETPTRRSEDRRPPLKGEVKPSPTLPRHLRLAILRLLRPAEAAARRLIIASARGLAVTLPAPRKASPKPVNPEPFLRRFGIAVVASPADLARAATARRNAALRAARPRTLSLPLFDAPRGILSKSKGRRYVPPHAAPRILFPGITAPHRLPPPPSPDDPIDAACLNLRLAALAAALDDLPGQAKRFARWKARQETARQARAPGRRISPLRSGRPPGGRLSRFDPSATRRSNIREVDEILAHAHALALYALQYPDTS
jgi:hypothetical protein